VEAWLHNSQHQKAWADRMIKRELLQKHPQSKLAIWGIAYKENTHSIKNSPSIEFMKSVKPCECIAYDPIAKLPKGLDHVRQVDSVEKTCEGADALCILTPWPEFKEKNFEVCFKSMKGKLLFDPFDIVPNDRSSSLQMKKFTLGKSLC
jgi:UDPglucose 6-dehydrogenase